MMRIKDKAEEITRFIEELEELAPSSIQEYESGLEKRAACERYVEKIVETATDLAFLVIKNKKLKIPESDIDAFGILMENKIVSEGLYEKLKNAKGMRNIIAHQYGKIDNEVVFEAVSGELGRDMQEFVQKVEDALK